MINKKIGAVLVAGAIAVGAFSGLGASASSIDVTGNWTKTYYNTKQHQYPTAKVTNNTNKTVKALVVVKEGKEVMEDTPVTLKPKETRYIKYSEAAGAGTYNGYVKANGETDQLGTFKMK